MFGLSFVEFLLIAVVAVLVIGPKEMPAVLYGLGRAVRRLQYVKYAFSQHFDDFMKTHDLDELRRGVNFEAPDYDEKQADADHAILPAGPKAGNKVTPDE